MDSHGQNNGRARCWQGMNPPHMQQPGMYMPVMPSFASVRSFSGVYPPHMQMGMMGLSGGYAGAVPVHHLHAAACQGEGGAPVGVGREKTTTTVWIGKIGSGVTDKSMRALLELVGGLVSWRRTTDKLGQVRAFGFADFASAKFALRAKALLTDLQLGESRLSLKVDEKTQAQLDEYVKQEHAQEAPEELEAISQQVKKLAKEVNEELGVSELESAPEKCRDEGGTEQQAAGAPARREDYQSSREKERRRDQERKRDRMEADREREARRQEQMKKEFRKLERKLEASQRDRAHDIERRREADEARRIAREEDIKLENEDTEEWRARICSSEYRRSRKRERELEELDREDEEAEIREERRLRMEEERRIEQHNLRLKREEEERQRIKEENLVQQKISDSCVEEQEPDRTEDATEEKPESAVEPVRIQLNPRFKLGTRLFEKNAMLGANGGAKKPDDDASEKSALKKSEDTQSILDLIPKEATPLFATPISWDLIEKHQMLESKIRPWVTRKIVEYLDVEETDLINFICRLILDRKPPREIISQLQPVLEDEADIFVLKLWRMLVYEMLRLEEAKVGS